VSDLCDQCGLNCSHWDFTNL